MMHISIDTSRPFPIYQQLAEQITMDIQQGRLPVGAKLPTVRALASENRLAIGTVRQAYDALVQQGYIVMNQGRGTFVRSATPIIPEGLSGLVSRKEQALLAIDRALGEILELGLSPREARIFFDLKLRELEGMGPVVRLGIVECCAEALVEIKNLIAHLPNVSISEFLLDDVLASPSVLAPNLDLLVSTETHAAQLRETLGEAHPMATVSMLLSPDTAAGLVRLPRDRRVGILCGSAQFQTIIHTACSRYCDLNTPPRAILWDEPTDFSEAFAGLDTLILPAMYQSLCPAPLLEATQTFLASRQAVIYHFVMDRDSLLALTRTVQELLNAELEHIPTI